MKMKNRWSDAEAAALISRIGVSSPAELPLLLYATRLLGEEADLALHGGGNTSVKTTTLNILGARCNSLVIKASGCSMTNATAEDFVNLDLDRLEPLRNCEHLSDEDMAAYFRSTLVRPGDRMPSIETLLHFLLPHTFVMHTHPVALLALTNRRDSATAIREALGASVAVIPYAQVGFECARASAEAVKDKTECLGLLIEHHGLVTWGASAKEAYDATIQLTSRAESYLAKKRCRPLTVRSAPACAQDAVSTYARIAPMVRGLLSPASGDQDVAFSRVILKHSANKEILELLQAQEAQQIIVSTPLTPDYLIRTRRFPLWIDSPRLDDVAALKGQIESARSRFIDEYLAYIKRQPAPPQIVEADLFPRAVAIPGVGIITAGATAAEAAMIADITLQTLQAKQTIFETGGDYRDLSEGHIFDMEFRTYQRAKLNSRHPSPLGGSVVLVTGSAGAIGSGICNRLLEAGCHVAASDLAGPALDETVKSFQSRFGADRVLGVGMDVTNPESVTAAFGQVVERFGGLDSLIANAGIAHVARLEDLELEVFRKLERVNTEGTLLTLKAAAKLFRFQGIGGDIVLISTKNVFSPGASFGAYSASKAAAHQLARIASLELADINVRVNMVAPDAVFAHGDRKSGLWAEVGPGRMKARGLDEAGLEEYYRKRNLLQAKVTAEHVAAAVLFFLRHETPTTGATIPVDGGLPDATPR